MGFTKPCYSEIHFPSGSFFWARPRALEPLWRAGFSWEDYPAEPVPYCGTMLHGIERIFPLVAEGSGYEIATSHIPGVTR
jgi:lipopolysaccharide biosynthesis protein